MSGSFSQNGSRLDNLSQPEIQTYTFNPLRQPWQCPTSAPYTPGAATSYPWDRDERSVSEMERPSKSPMQDMNCVLNDFCIGMIELLQLQQARGASWQSPMQRHNSALGWRCVSAEHQLRSSSPKYIPVSRKRKLKLTSSVPLYAAGKRAKQTIKRHVGKTLLQLLRQTEQHGTHDAVLQSMARKYPKYRTLISVIPFVVEHMPQRLQERLAKRARSKTGRIALTLFRRWALK